MIKKELLTGFFFLVVLLSLKRGMVDSLASRKYYRSKKYGQGTSDPGKIKLIRIGWDKDILI